MSNTNPLDQTRTERTRSHGLVARLAAAGALIACFGAPVDAMDRIARIDGIVSVRTAEMMADSAAEIGEAILSETIGYCFGEQHLFVSTRFERTGSYALDDLAGGLDLEYAFFAQESLPTDYYTHRVEVADPKLPISPTKHFLLTADGETAAEGEGSYDFFGQIPDPGETREWDCETSAGFGTGEDGVDCINLVTICEDGENFKIMQACLKPA